MKRRYIALLAVVVPVAVVYGFKLTNTPIYDWLMGYLIAIVLVFKTSLLSLWFATKLKFIAFVKGLTVVQSFLLIIKRWLLDNVLMEWLKKNVFSHIKEAFDDIKAFYMHLNFKAKLKQLGNILIFGSIFVLLGYLSGYLDHLLFFAQVKLLATALMQGIITYATKIITTILSWFTSSWLAPILQVFALSYLLTLIEKWFGPDNPVSRFFNAIGDKLNTLLYYFGLLKQKHIDPVECKVVQGSQKVNAKLRDLIKNKKIKEEFLYMERFENIIMQGHINAYYSIKDMDKVTDKRELYRIINQKTKDNIDIVAFVSRNKYGILLEESIKDSFYHDIFLLESFASHQEHGVKVYDEPQDPNHIDHTDFWVLNTSKFPVIIGSESNNFNPQCIQPHGLALIQTKHPFSYEEKDVYAQYEGVKVYVTPVER